MCVERKLGSKLTSRVRAHLEPDESDTLRKFAPKVSAHSSEGLFQEPHVR
jgi:hypothetical protein